VAILLALGIIMWKNLLMDNVNYTDDFKLEMDDSGQTGPRRRSAAPEPSRGPVRLRRPERRQMAWVGQCLDDLLPPEHSVRRIAAVVEHVDVSGFCQTIKAREGVVGRDATDPKLLVALWLYACVRGIGGRGNWRGSARSIWLFAGCAGA